MNVKINYKCVVNRIKKAAFFQSLKKSLQHRFCRKLSTMKWEFSTQNGEWQENLLLNQELFTIIL